MVKMRLMVILPLFGMNSLTHSPLAAAISLKIGGELDKEVTVVTLFLVVGAHCNVVTLYNVV